ncbi:MAG: TonB-dependent receptor [Bacteroidales bacterium]
MEKKSEIVNQAFNRGKLAVLLILFFSLIESLSAFAERPDNGAILQNIVKGNVTSTEDGSALPGVNIQVKGTTSGTVTDLSGDYTINIEDQNAVLVFSYTGYKVQEIPVNGQSVINVQLVPDVTSIDEVVVVGYGTQKKVNLSGAVDVVSSEGIENRPVSNLTQALQGASPSLNISVSNSGGEMGAKMNMNIRGIGSINGGMPYVLVDGMEQDINNLNPDDIESISVLKDAASSSIYGARAAFGVILITTKKGKNDGISVNYSNNYSFAAPTIVPHSVDSRRFADYLNVASVNDGSPPLFQKIILDYMDQYLAGEIDYWTIPFPLAPQYWLLNEGAWANTDWYDVNYKKWVPNNMHNLSISGGDKRTQFFVSGSIFNQEGLLNFGTDNYGRNTLNTKINTKIFDWLRFNLVSKYSSVSIERPSYDKDLLYDRLARQWPTNAPYFPDGTSNYEAVQIWLEQGGMYNEKNNELSVIPGIEIEPVKGWVIYSNFRWRMNTGGNSNHEAQVIGTLADGTQGFLRAENSYATNAYSTYYTSPNIYSTYTKKIGKHDFTIMAGYEQELYKYQTVYAKRYGLVSDEVPSLQTATGRQESNGNIGHSSTQSFFGRLNYNFSERYLFEFSIRYDGSSKFPEGYRFGTFPSGSLAWVISKENFWASIAPVVNNLKIRTSFGSLGNQNVDNYLYVERLPISTNLAYIMDKERPNYVSMADLVSPGLTWEKVKTQNAGIDLSFLNYRLSASFDYFIRNTYDMLGPAESLPAVLGTDVPKSNNATLQTKGFELSLEWKDNIQNFSYGARFILSDAVSTVTKYYNPQNLLSASYYEGMELGEIWGFNTVGLFESDDQAQSVDQSYFSADVLRAGDVHYQDLNGDGKVDIGKNTVDDPGDKSIIGNSTPRYAYSLALNAAWKGFDLNVLFQGIGKRDLWLDSPIFWGAGGKYWLTAYEEHMDYWTEENTDAYWPRPYIQKGYKNKQVQTLYLQNGAFLRLKSVQLGYTLPVNLTQKVKIKNLRVFFSGENLLTFTKLFEAFDPEATGGARANGYIYPLQKVLSGGINITF